MTPEQEKIYEDAFIAGMQKQMQSSVDKAVNAMAQRTWVDLTDEDINTTYWKREPFRRPTPIEFAHDILTKFKEKNSG
jgi:hypothetical protein